MLKRLTIPFALLTATIAAADGNGNSNSVAAVNVLVSDKNPELDQFLWESRPLVVFADSSSDPRFIQQMDFINDGINDMAERDVIVLTDTDPNEKGYLRSKLHPRGFMLVLIGKDGIIYLRKPFPWDAREISRVIDKMPIRQQEIRDRRGKN
ncbi:MAG: DUF4174 domain-containing protein [Roseovarius sp.]|nr:DUF4174 domain-containing protein [Roseovarius sp.]MCY4209313.1 DUF4174 domain-containing protein [Roseovarius sp.]MCY4292700.1 DUF4174 domain-containing protein [Roseovarius sp.]MCY4316611.1 DUF4174 domain-containing protein [Roseovarius sp.]